jgi:hypothetical protein
MYIYLKKILQIIMYIYKYISILESIPHVYIYEQVSCIYVETISSMLALKQDVPIKH